MELVFYGLIFVFMYFLYYFLILKKSNHFKDYQKSIEMQYLANRYKLDFKKFNLKKLVRIISILNSFIITLTLYFIQYFDHIVIKIFGAFFILIVLQLIGYHLLGKKMQKEEKNV